MNYHQKPGLSRSDLHGLYYNPGRWQMEKTGQLPPRMPSEAMSLGSQLDAMMTGGKGPDPLPANAVVLDDVANFRTNKAKEKRDAILAERPDAVVLSKPQADRMRAEGYEAMQRLESMAASLMACTQAWKLFKDPLEKQPELYWSEHIPELDYLGSYKAMPDLRSAQDVYTDLKTSNGLGERNFRRKTVDHWYHVQAEMTIAGHYRKYGRTATFLDVCVCTEAPYEVEIWEYDSAWLERAYEARVRATAVFKECSTYDRWSLAGYGEPKLLTNPPTWSY